MTGLEPLTATRELYGQRASTLQQCVVPLHLLISARKSFPPLWTEAFDVNVGSLRNFLRKGCKKFMEESAES